GDVTPAADVFSLGVVFYEMLAGRRPFEGGTTSEVVTAILSKAPPPLHGLRADAPPKLEALVRKALAKNVDERYRDAGEMHEQLRLMSREGIVITPSVRRSRGVTLAVALVAAVIAIAGAGWWKLEQARARRDALLKIDAAESLVSQHKLADAYQTAVEAAMILPNDDRIRDIISRTSDRLRIESDPPGAVVYLQRFGGPDQRVRMGVTPLTIPRLARADYLMTLVKPGYANGVRTISTTPIYYRGEPFVQKQTVH